MQRKNLVGQLLYFSFSFTNCILPQVFVESDHLIMSCLNRCTKRFHHLILCSYFFLQFPQVLHPAYFLTFYHPHTATGQGILSFYILTILFYHYKAIAVL